MTALEKECVFCPWWHTYRAGQDVVKGTEKLDLVAFQSKESKFLIRRGVFLSASPPPHTPHYFSGKSREA